MNLSSGADKLPGNFSVPEERGGKHSNDVCRLCGSTSVVPVFPVKDSRNYHRCTNCSLLFVDSSFFLTEKEEVLCYRNHHNTLENKGYVTFLNRVIEPSVLFFEKGMIGLDYGCGPGPVLSTLVREKGFKCYNYDPLFAVDHPFQSYDFIFSTECFEHFHYPAKDLENILGLLKTGGFLCLMTELWDSIQQFEHWYYKLDPTHASFYHSNTLEFIKNKYGLKEMFSDGKRVIVLRKE